MKITFKVDYRTFWGQRLFICGNSPALGNWDPAKACPMELTVGETWAAAFEISDPTISYKYLVRNSSSNEDLWEFGENRLLNLENIHDTSILIRDHWRSDQEINNSLFSSPFSNAFFKRNTIVKKSGKSTANYIRLQIRAPRCGQDYSLGVLGSTTELGLWEEDKVVLLNDTNFPLWQIDLPISSPTNGIEYKYVIYSHKENRIVTWEQRSNRHISSAYLPVNFTLIWTDEVFHYPVGNWKGAGVAIPVFSIKTKKSSGVGEFTDIALMVDWAKRTGIRMIQILPINDTVATHTWVDSYPYAAISVHALHPIYAGLEAMGQLKNEIQNREIEQEAKRLNDLTEIDYEAVMRLKSKFFKLLYDQEKKNISKDYAYQAFVSANEKWLLPYALFSYFRDKFRTPDYTRWGEYSSLSIDKMKEFASEEGKHFDDIAIHFFIQYHLDKQLMEASNYARANKVVLKGDIPIGIYRNSVDAWLQPELYNMDGQAGAPPDDFSISGQNWGFPTYNWDKMASDNYQWWRDRLVKMADYFDVFRIDHILGFFRIWEIPVHHVEGILGRFNPSLPFTKHELSQWGIPFDWERFCKPYIRFHQLESIFSSNAHEVFDNYLEEYAPGKLQFREMFNTQRKLKEHFDQLVLNSPGQSDYYNWLRFQLYRLHAEVIFLETPLSNGEAFDPRIAFHSTFSYQELDEHLKSTLDKMYNHYFYHRHNDFWRESAMRKLPSLKAATNMLICGEDLGMVPSCVPGVMNDLSILSLAIQRMPNDDRVFWHPSDTPYLSVTSTGSHDMSTLREWWQEDPDKTQRFYNTILGKAGGAPYYCEPWIARDIINQHMHSPSMWAIFPIQDLLAMDSRLRRLIPEEERINVPSNPQHYWRYRMHVFIESLLHIEDFNAEIREMIDRSGRSADY